MMDKLENLFDVSDTQEKEKSENSLESLFDVSGETSNNLQLKNSNIDNFNIDKNNVQRIEEGNDLFSLPNEDTSSNITEPIQDIGKGVIETLTGLGTGALTYLPSIAAKQANVYSHKAQAWAKKSMSKKEWKQFEKDMKEVGNDIILNPEEIKKEGEKISTQISSLGGLVKEPKTEFGKNTLGIVNKGFGLVHSGVENIVEPFVDKDKNPNLYSALTDGVEFGILSAIHPIAKKGYVKGLDLLEKAKRASGKRKIVLTNRAKENFNKANEILDEFITTEEGQGIVENFKQNINPIMDIQTKENILGINRQRNLQGKLNKVANKIKKQKDIKIQKQKQSIIEQEQKIKAQKEKQLLIEENKKRAQLFNEKQKKENLNAQKDQRYLKQRLIKKNKKNTLTDIFEIKEKKQDINPNINDINNLHVEENKLGILRQRELQSKLNKRKFITKDKKINKKDLQEYQNNYQKQLQKKLSFEKDLKDEKLLQANTLEEKQKSISTFLDLEKNKKQIKPRKIKKEINKKNVLELEKELLINKKYLNTLEELKNNNKGYVNETTGKEIPINESAIKVLKDKIDIISNSLKEKQNLFNKLIHPLVGETGAIEVELKPKKIQALELLNKEAKKKGLDLEDYLAENGMEHEKIYKVKELMDTNNITPHSIKKSKLLTEKEIIGNGIKPGLRQLFNNPKHEKFFNYLSGEGRMLNPYKGDIKVPDFIRPIIGKEAPVIRPKYTDQKWYHEGQSPHHQFDYAYSLKDNPSYDFMDSYMSYHQNVGNQKLWAKDVIDRIWTKDSKTDLDNALKPIQEKLKDKIKQTFISQESIKNRENKINRLRKGKTKEDLITLNEKEKKRVVGALKDINEKMNKHLEKVLPNLAKKHSAIRVMLDIEGKLPEGIKLSEYEIKIKNEIKNFFEKSKEELKRNDIPVIEDNYIPNFFKAALGEEGNIGKILGVKEKKLPMLLKFQHKFPGSRNWYPDMETILNSYIPIVNKKLAYQPYLNRWAEAVPYMPPKLKKYYSKWLDKNLNKEPLTDLEQIGNAVMAMEYFRTIGFSLSTAFKHGLKTTHTLAETGLPALIKNEGKMLAVKLDEARRKLGRDKTPAMESRLIDSYYNTKSAVELLEGAGLESASHMAKTVPGAMTTFIENMENGINVLATIEAGMKKGIDPGIIQKKIWEAILDANFRLGPDEFVWRKNNTLGRTFTMFVNTPAKMLEHQTKLVRKALTNKKDNFGTHYGKKLMYMLASIGMIESIAQANGTSVMSSLVHMPKAHSLVETGTTIQKAISNPGDLEADDFAKALPQLRKIYRVYQNDYNRKYYNSNLEYLLGIQRNKLRKKSGQRKRRRVIKRYKRNSPLKRG